MKRFFIVQVWNEVVAREYYICAENHKDARNKAIAEEVDRGSALYQIHIEHVNVVK